METQTLQYKNHRIGVPTHSVRKEGSNIKPDGHGSAKVFIA